jgi:hypothetical protein
MAAVPSSLSNNSSGISSSSDGTELSGEDNSDELILVVVSENRGWQGRGSGCLRSYVCRDEVDGTQILGATNLAKTNLLGARFKLAKSELFSSQMCQRKPFYFISFERMQMLNSKPKDVEHNMYP